MTHADSRSTRTYRSEVRAERTRTTRRRILDAAVQLMALRPTEWSIPSVADAAGVSVPTVYRHFGDKAGLVDAVVPHVGDRLGLRPRTPPSDLDDMASFIRELFHHYDQADPLIRAALASGKSSIRAESVAVRMNLIRKSFEQASPGLSPGVVDSLARVTVILTCSEALRLWQDRFDLGIDEVAEHVADAIRAMLAGSAT